MTYYDYSDLIITCGSFDGIMVVLWFISFISISVITYTISAVLL